jgi:Tol biopolymer transport system component
MQITGVQPRISPKNDVLLFTVTNDQTGKRDIYQVGATGGRPQNLTNTPDIDEFDPVWSSDGNRIAFASDRGLDPREKRRNYDIWVIDPGKPDRLTQITRNGSHDDCPAWDPAGRAIYFRSNRGGAWGVWKLPLK